MMTHVTGGVLLAVGLALAGCETVLSGTMDPFAIDKSAKGDELIKETTVGIALPAGCSGSKTALPAGQTTMTVSYREPKTTVDGAPLSTLGYTTIYLTSDKGQPVAIRVWTNNALGDSKVTVRDIPVPGPEFGLCVTATNWGRKESAPATPAPAQPAR